MGRIWDSAAAQAAATRLLATDGAIYPAFDNLACGIDHGDAISYLRTVMPPDARIIGAALAFAMVAVESDRALREKGRRRV